VLSFTSDWLFPTAESRVIADAVTSAGATVELREILSDKGHDSFLLEEPELLAAIRGFLNSVAAERNVG
jgi:homoserine O-acetyltransferase